MRPGVPSKGREVSARAACRRGGERGEMMRIPVERESVKMCEDVGVCKGLDAGEVWRERGEAERGEGKEKVTGEKMRFRAVIIKTSCFKCFVLLQAIFLPL